MSLNLGLSNICLLLDSSLGTITTEALLQLLRASYQEDVLSGCPIHDNVNFDTLIQMVF